MSDTSTVRKVPPQAQSSGSGHTLMSKRQPFIKEPFASKHVCFYKSGDAQFNGLPVVINKRTFKTFDGLLDSLSKRIPLPFGVRTITTPRGQTAVRSLDQLHHGHSYICSDKRTVKPIDLEQARRKPPPWYHARPISTRRLASTRESFGPRSAPWNEYAAMLHTPKRVVVFCNGAPDVKHTLLLQKRNTRSFKELIDLLSEVMNFPVHKLYTVDGKRVDGLLALILCSGVLVASGREPFRKDSYNIQKPSAPTWLPAKGVKRLHHKTRKGKSFSSSTRPFSPSSERYIVNQLHKSFSEDAYNSNGSGGRKTEQHVDSIEADTMTCKDVTAQESIYMPNNDDIEKSFRVNEDGSMTVEMKVHLTIKNEETVQWTTTLSRSTVANQLTFVSESHTDLGELPCDNISSDVDSKTLVIKQIGPEKHREHSLQAAPLEESSTGQSVVVKESLQPSSSSLGWCQSKHKQLSLASTNNISKTKDQHNVLGLYTDNEETSNEQIKQEYPVPKPRNIMSCKLNTTSSQQQSNIYESAEVLQLQDSEKEAVLHIFKQQMCQKSFLAEQSHHGINKYVSSSDQPTSFNNVFPAGTNVPSSVDDNISTTDGPLHRDQCKETTSQLSNIQTAEKPLVMKSAKLSTTRISSAAGNCRNKKPVRVIVKKSCRSHIALHEHMRKQTKIDILKEIKKIRAVIFSQAGVMRTMIKYYQAKAVYKLLKNSTNRNTDHRDVSSTVHNAVQLKIKRKSITEYCNSTENVDQTCLSSGKQNHNLAPVKTNLLYISTNKSTFKRQTSMQNEQDFQRETSELRESASLPALHFSPSVSEHMVQKEEPPPKLQPSLQVSMVASETRGVTKESCENLTADSCSTIVSVTKSLKENISFSKKDILTRSPSAKRQLLTRESTKDKSFSSLSKNNNYTLLSDKETKLDILNLSLNNSSTKENCINFEELFQSKDSSSKNYPAASLNKLYTVNDHPSPKMPLISQHFIEAIPSNNTMSMASLFTNQGTEMSPQSDIIIKHSSLNRRSESLRTFLERSKARSDLLNLSSQKDLSTSETDKDTSASANGKETTMQGKKSYIVKMAVQPDLRPTLNQLCHAIKSLSEVTRNKQRSSSVKSKSMPDFFSYLASSFGSSSQVLLAFLSVMTLKDSLENLTVQHQADNSSSCAEALLLLLSFKEMANIKNAEELRSSLDALKNSMSDKLLHSWRNFQEVCNQSIKCSVKCMCNRSKSCSELDYTQEGIQGLLEELGVPERVIEELSAFCTHEESISDNTVVESDKLFKTFPEIKLNKCTNPVLNEEIIRFHDSTLKDNVSQYISSVIEKAVNAHSKECKSLHDSTAHSLVSAKNQIKVGSSKQERNVCSISDAYQNITSSRSVLIEQHQGVEKQDVKSTRETKSGVVEQKHKGDKEIQINMNENKDSTIYNDSVQTPRRISGKVSVQEDYIVLDNLKYSESSHNEDKLVTSLEEEDYNCDGEYMDFSKDLINNKVESILMSQSIVSGTEQHHSSQNSTNGHKKSLSSQEQSQPYSHRDTLKGSPEIIMEEPDYYVYEEHSGDQKEHGFKDAVVYEKNTPQTKTYSVAELINNMESFTQQTINKPERHVNKFLIQTDISEPLDTDNLNNISSHSNTSHLTSETLPSSLAFSYESLSSSLAQEKERTTHINRVKSIREMFLAKSSTKTQHRQLHIPISDHSESIKSVDIWSQRSPETSSGEDDTCRSAIAKGFVRRTIERIYGRGNMNSTMPNDIRPQSASQGKRRKCPGRTNVTELASFHEARVRLMSDLAYFSATSSCEVFNAPAHEQVDSRDTNSPEKDPSVIEKKNTTILTEPLEQNATDYSHNRILPCNDSLATTISYFNLPNASDSELEPEEQKSNNNQIEDKVTPEPQMLKSWTVKNSFLPVFTPPVFKKADNKVHPLKEALTSPVVTQPVSGQSAQTGVVIHSTEPDLLEMLFIFCGRHCPIL